MYIWNAAGVNRYRFCVLGCVLIQ